MKSNIVTTISNRTKVLKRPARFIGSTSLIEENTFIFENNRVVKKNIKFVPGLIKIIEEVIDNSIDEAVRTNFKFANKIQISTKEDWINDWISVKDNGRGIPIQPTKNEDGTDGKTLMPEGAWTLLNTGSNFTDEEDNITMGQNGEGVSLTNIFSKEFIGETADGKKYLKLVSKNNMETYDIEIKDSKRKFTKVSFKPDFEKFGIKEWDINHEKILEFKIAILSLAYPQIEFKLNNKVIKIENFKNFIKSISDNFEYVEVNNLSVAVVHNTTDNFNFIHIINGINSFNGGKPLDWIVSNITNKLKDKIIRRYKNIKTGDIKNKLFVIAIFKNMFNPRFEDQIKSVCTNTYSQFQSQIGEIDFDKFVNKIYKNSYIIDPILETYKLKEEAKRRLELKKLKKVKKDIFFDKYLPSTSSKKYLLIVEGDSAMGGLSSELGRDGFSYYGLKGKPLNAYSASHQKFMKNKELKELFEIINNDTHQIDLFATDQDLDGFSIRGLLIGFYKKYFPDRLKQGKVGFLQTPLIVTLDKRGKIKETFYSFNEYNQFVEKYGDNHQFKYLKGLGSYEDGELEQVIKKDGFDRMVDIIDYDEDRDDIIIENWLSDKTSDKRKDYIISNNFDLSKI
jgi:DNA gyrase/topoisomerase IV subunit B